MTLSGYTLLALQGSRWFGLRQRHQHLVEGLSRHFGRTIHVEMSATFPGALRNRSFPLLDAWAHHLPPRRLSDKLWLIKAPPGLPQQLGIAKVNKHNQKVIAGKIRKHISPDEKLVLFISGPRGVDILEYFEPHLVIFDCFDAFSSFTAVSHDRDAIETMEHELVGRSDIVLATTPGLKSKFSECLEKIYLVPNACDYEHFARQHPPSPGFKHRIKLKSLSRPLIGYMGDIGDWLDRELIGYLASSRPEWNFIFFGHPQVDISMLKSIGNVHFPGRIPYTDLPFYIHDFNCLLIPFILNDLTREVNPVKMYEYLATGKPIVSTPLPEVAKHGDLIGVAGTPEDFLARVEHYLIRDTDQLREKRRSLARENSWKDRVETVRILIEDGLEKRQ